MPYFIKFNFDILHRCVNAKSGTITDNIPE